VCCYGSETGCRVEGLTVSGNYSGHGGGVANVERFVGLCRTLELTGVVLEGNTAAEGGGLWADCPVVLADSSVTGNYIDPRYGAMAMSGGGAWLENEGTLTSTGTDWGSGKTDNAPEDVSVEGVPFTDLSGSFACDPATQSCRAT
jgi:hypothetical protein